MYSHNFMEHKVVEHNSRVVELERLLETTTKRSNDLQDKVNEQEVEITSLVSCLDALRIQIARFHQAGQPDVLSQYDIRDQLAYATKARINELKDLNVRRIKTDLFDLQIEKTRLQTQMDILNRKISELTKKYASELEE